jgi:hypothetical protein
MNFSMLSVCLLTLVQLSIALPQIVSVQGIVANESAKIRPTASHYVQLQNSLKTNFVTLQNTPRLVRMSFHDLLNFNKATGSGGAQGCLFDARVAAFKENGGLNGTAQVLKKFVETRFPNVAFSSGDIISLAGKVAIEAAYPCLTIKWSFGRPSCTQNEIESGPGPEINTLAKMRPFLKRYGLTLTEMATLTTGAHAVAGSRNTAATSGIFSFTFAKVTSGVDFIKKTVRAKQMIDFGTWFGNFAGSPTSTFPDLTFGRFPSDMMFFPDTVAKTGATPDRSPEIAAVQSTFLAHTDATFNKAFGAVFAKMLEIGTSNLTLLSPGAARC